MSEQGKDLPKKFTRREAVVIGSLAIAALAVGKLAGSGSQSKSADTSSTPDIKPTHTPQPASTPSPALTPQPEIELKSLGKKGVETERPNMVFGHYEEEDKGIVFGWIEKYIEEFKEDKMGIKQVKGLQQEIVNVVNILGTGKNFWAVKVLPALIFVETRGDPNRVSEKGARGVSQVMKKTASEVAAGLPLGKRRALGIGIPPNLRDNKISIALSIKYLQQLLDQFFDPSLALLAYYEGMGTMDRITKEYLLSTKKATLEEIDKTEPNPRDPEKGLGYLINKHKVNYVRLKGWRTEIDKDDYVLKTAAADEILSS